MTFAATWLVFIAINVLIHWYVIEKRKRSPNKKIWTAIRIVALIATAALFPWNNFWWHMLAGWLMFTYAFEYPLNLLRGKPIAYQGKKGLDGLQKKIINNDDFWFLFDFALFIIGLVILTII